MTVSLIPAQTVLTPNSAANDLRGARASICSAWHRLRSLRCGLDPTPLPATTAPPL